MFDLPNNLFFLIGIHWKNMKVYTADTVGNAYFKLRDYDDLAVYFDRVSFMFGWNL
jgi:hypothetical protein